MLSTMEPPERRPSPLLSNNPFRNRAASPTSLHSPTSPSFRPTTSTNPFLDMNETQTTGGTIGVASPKKQPLVGNTAELFENLVLNDKQDKPAPPTNGAPRRPENMPPESRRNGSPNHRPMRSRDEEERRRRMMPARGKPGEPANIFADPSDQKPRERIQRRNSDTSVMEQASKLLDPEEERRRRRHKEREARRKEGRHGSSKPRGPNHRLDIIDKLDVTSIFGTGAFHHDGPFDACNPHRNRKGLRAAPMMAFPKDSSNMAIGGAGPLHKDIDHAQFHGFNVESYNDFSATGGASEPVARPRYDGRGSLINPTMKADLVHGDESMGLGTSTFLEGAPASRLAIKKTETENEAAMMAMNGGPGAGGGLGRKKSLAQRIRGISNSRPNGPRMTSPDPLSPNQRLRPMTPTSPPLASSASAGPTTGRAGEANPYFQDYDKEYERKGVKIAEAEADEGRDRAVSSPKRTASGLERTTTNDSNGGGEAAKTGGGLLNRVKSLKGARRTRPEKRDAS